MGKRLVLKAEVRDPDGIPARREKAAKVRARGRIPAIVYGHKQAAAAISLDAHNFVEGLHHGHRLIDLVWQGPPIRPVPARRDLAGTSPGKETVLVKDVQYDYLGRDIIHVDLMRVDVNETVKVGVPMELKGTAQGTHEGGIIEEHVGHLEVECMVIDIPEKITVFVKDVSVGDALHASDVELPKGVKLVSPPDTLIVTCHLVAAAKTAEQVEEEMPTAPDVIGEAEEGPADEAGEKGFPARRD